MLLRFGCVRLFGWPRHGAVISALRRRAICFSVAIPLGQLIRRRCMVQCLQPESTQPQLVGSRSLYYDQRDPVSRNWSIAFLSGVVRWIRICFRFWQLLIVFGPLLITYPFARRSETMLVRWRSWAFYLVERSGPAIIKFAQWASTRRDLFSKEFCDLFSQLHVSTSQHSWKRTEAMLVEALGDEWRSYFLEFSETSCGSGCVAQVHKARLDYIAVQRAPREIRTQFETCDKPWIDVAIKVSHPGVKQAITDDLTIMTGLAKVLKWVAPMWRYVDPEKCLDEFHDALIRQVDLRYEGDALRLFSKQFEDDKSIHFPQPLFQTENVLVETFEEGKHISNYLTCPDKELKHVLAKDGIDALLKMIFINNFVHGDLHPGNILVQEYDDATRRRGFRKWWDDLLKNVGARDVSGLVASDDFSIERRTRLVFLDVGISIRLSQKDLENLRAVFKAVVDGDGLRTGDLLLRYAPQERCPDRKAFLNDVETLVGKFRTISLGTTDVSTLLSDLLSTASRHRVSLEPNFTCVVLAVMVLEGLGRSLDPQLDLIEEARPVLRRVM